MSAPKLTPFLVIVVLLFLGGIVDAATPGMTRLEGRLPDTVPVVSVDQTRGTILDALSTIAKQAGWTLVVTSPESLTSRNLAIQMKARPANEALDLVLEAGSLRATFADGVLKVRPDVTASPGGSRRERRRERGGRREAERVVLGGSLRIDADEVVRRAVAIGGSLTVLGHVRGDAVAVGGSVTLLPGARVEGDTVAIGGAVTLPPGARVEGDAVAVGGAVIAEEGASLEGNNVSLGGTVPTIIGSLIRWGVGSGSHLRSFVGVGAMLARGILLFGIVLLVSLAFPDHVAHVRTFLASRPGFSLLGGLAVLVGFIPLCVLLAVTIIGIPLIPIAVMLLVALFVFGITAAALWLGERIPLLGENKTPLKAVALGGAGLALVGLIPWIGTLAIFLAAMMAAGATLLSRFGRRGGVPA